MGVNTQADGQAGIARTKLLRPRPGWGLPPKGGKIANGILQPSLGYHAALALPFSALCCTDVDPNEMNPLPHGLLSSLLSDDDRVWPRVPGGCDDRVWPRVPGGCGLGVGWVWGQGGADGSVSPWRMACVGERESERGGRVFSAGFGPTNFTFSESPQQYKMIPQASLSLSSSLAKFRQVNPPAEL